MILRLSVFFGLTLGTISGTKAMAAREVTFEANGYSEDHTTFFNVATSSDVILARSLISNINTFYVVPPGHLITFFASGAVHGAYDSFQATLRDSDTIWTLEVTSVSNCSKGPSSDGPWTPIKVGDKLKTCEWYKCDEMNCSSLEVVDPCCGNKYKMPHSDTIRLLIPHHVPNDPRFTNETNFRDFANFNYGVLDGTYEYWILTGPTVENPGAAQGGVRTPIAEAVIPQRKRLPNIPTLSEWGLIAMAGLLVTAGAIVIVRRRRRVAA